MLKKQASCAYSGAYPGLPKHCRKVFAALHAISLYAHIRLPLCGKTTPSPTQPFAATLAKTKAPAANTPPQTPPFSPSSIKVWRKLA
jgi:hypothetical protein